VTLNTEAHRRLAEAVRQEFLAATPRDFSAALRYWHRGSLSLVHLNVLSVLDADGPLPMGRLADALDVSVASVTGIVDRMEKRGLVERRRDEADRRVVLVDLADGGREALRRISEGRREGLGQLLIQLTDEELSGLLAGHRAMNRLRSAAAAALAARAAEGHADQSSPTSPPGVHGGSTTSADDRSVPSDDGTRT
jgi:DNA-binding MarR family transcriptional regulator